MTTTISPTIRKRLNIQGLTDIPDETLAAVVPWHRLAFVGCATLAGIGVATASPTMLGILAVIAALGAIFPVHPFDLIYNHGIRYLRNTGPLPKRQAPTRFACGMGAFVLVATAWAFQSGALITGYVLGGQLVAIATLVAATDICIPSMVYNMMFVRSK